MVGRGNGSRESCNFACSKWFEYSSFCWSAKIVRKNSQKMVNQFSIHQLLFGILDIKLLFGKFLICKLLSCKFLICTLLSCKLLFGIFVICKLLFGKFVIAELLFGKFDIGKLLLGSFDIGKLIFSELLSAKYRSSWRIGNNIDQCLLCGKEVIKSTQIPFEKQNSFEWDIF